MALELTFPVFYHGAIRNCCGVKQQYIQMNLLLNGTTQPENPGDYVQKDLASSYANGRKSLPDWRVQSMCALSDEELTARLQLLEFVDVYAVAESLIRLLDIVSVSAPRRRELLRYAGAPETVYLFLCDLLRAAISNSPRTVRLKAQDLNKINTCRNALPSEGAQGSEAKTAPSTSPPKESSVSDASPLDPEEDSQSCEPTLDPLDPEDLFADPLSEFSPLQSTILLVATRHDPPPKCSFKTMAGYYHQCLQAQVVFCHENEEIIGQSPEITDILETLSLGDFRRSFLLEISGHPEEVLAYLRCKSDFEGAESALMLADAAYQEDTGCLDELCTLVQNRLGPHRPCLFYTRQHKQIPEDQISLWLLLV